jgi:carboxymethylenebutenolidase
MCFAFDAQPPELPADVLARLPRLAGAAPPEIVELTSADGTPFSAAIAVAPEPATGNVAVAIIPDVRGLYPFYITLAERFAQAGHHAVTVDVFGRTAGLGPRDEDFDFWPHVLASDPEQVREDVAAALESLRRRTGPGPNVVLGFCFGGSQAFLAATDPGLDIEGVVGFYGGLDGTRLEIPSPREHADESIRTVLALFGGADEGIPATQREQFAAGLAVSGVEHEIIVYDGAPHSFFDRRFEEHAPACEDAWRRVLSFLEEIGAKSAVAGA